MFGYEMTDYDKKVYEEEIRDFVPKNIVDSHVHVWRTEDDLFDRVNFPRKSYPFQGRISKILCATTHKNYITLNFEVYYEKREFGTG